MHDFQLSSWQADNQLAGKTLLHYAGFGLSRQIVSQICDKGMYLQKDWETVWILIGWIRQKPVDLDLQCFEKWTNLGSLGKG